MFGINKKGSDTTKDKNAESVFSPVKGEVVSIKTVTDPTFSQEILGKGLAIKPSTGRIVAPFNATISMMFNTNHAVSLVSDTGIELLIHVGLDTVSLKGKHYTGHFKNNDKVKKGDVLIEFDMDALKNEGYDVITPVIVCNSQNYKNVKLTLTKSVNELDEIMVLKK